MQRYGKAPRPKQTNDSKNNRAVETQNKEQQTTHRWQKISNQMHSSGRWNMTGKPEQNVQNGCGKRKGVDSVRGEGGGVVCVCMLVWGMWHGWRGWGKAISISKWTLNQQPSNDEPLDENKQAKSEWKYWNLWQPYLLTQKPKSQRQAGIFGRSDSCVVDFATATWYNNTKKIYYNLDRRDPFRVIFYIIYSKKKTKKKMVQKGRQTH